jgi:hypothetical protein
MLDRLKLSKDLERVADHLFPEVSTITQLAAKLWQDLSNDPTFRQRAADAESSFMVPSWRGNLNDITAVPVKQPYPYTIIATDGSQIYPDRHIAGAGCFLLNTGGVVLSYGSQPNESSAQFFSEPRVCLPTDVAQINEKSGFSSEIVDLLREDDELRIAVQKTREELQHDATRKPVVFIDGTIIFWPLEGKSPAIKEYFLGRYLKSLEALYKLCVPYAGFISMPKSRELVSLLKLGLCRYTVANCIPCHSAYTEFPCKAVDMLIDTHVVRSFVGERQRTTLFASSSKIIDEYPPHLKPLFCYLDVGREIVRLEIPTWVANDEKLLQHVCQVALDQSLKGDGYPVCLAEAHEQAVVKGPDREFFYHLIHKIGLSQNRQLHASRKSMKKRGIGV